MLSNGQSLSQETQRLVISFEGPAGPLEYMPTTQMRRHRCSFSLRRFFRWLTSDNFGERTLMIRRTSLLSTALVSVLCVLTNGALAQDVAAPAAVDGGIGDIVVTISDERRVGNECVSTCNSRGSR